MTAASLRLTAGRSHSVRSRRDGGPGSPGDEPAETSNLIEITEIGFDPKSNLPFQAGSLSSLTLDLPAPLSAGEALSVLRECRRVLRPGGGIEAPEDWLATAAELVAAADAEHALETPDRPALDRVARYSGLRLDADARLLVRPAVIELSDEPLVSVLVPGYRVAFLDAVLRSATQQTWKRVEILVGDDCETDDVERLTRASAESDERVRYIGRASERGGRANMVHLLHEAEGDLIKFLNDDDVLDHRCVERMVRCLQAFPSVTLVTSHRQPIDAVGREISDLTSTKRRVAADSVIDGAAAASDLLRLRYNWIGEPTTTMFRRAALDTEVPFGVGDAVVRSSGDFALWLKLLSRGDLVYLADTLSYFRQHDGQRQKQPEFMAIAEQGHDRIIAAATALGLDEPRSRHFVATPLDVRPWWSQRAGELVRGLTLENAEASLAELADELPGDTVVDLLAAQVALNSGDAEQAVRILDAAADRDRGSVAVLKLMAIALLHLDARPAAQRILWLAEDLCPHDEDASALLGLLWDELSAI